jgi:hypothetical protein
MFWAESSSTSAQLKDLLDPRMKRARVDQLETTSSTHTSETCLSHDTSPPRPFLPPQRLYLVRANQCPALEHPQAVERMSKGQEQGLERGEAKRRVGRRFRIGVHLRTCYTSDVSTAVALPSSSALDRSEGAS